MIVCYECHTPRAIDDVLVAEDLQTQGLAATQSGNYDLAVELYRKARDLLISANIPCHRHVPPLFVAAQNERQGFDIPVWLPSLFGCFVTTCQICKQKRPCIDCHKRDLRATTI